MKHVRKIIAALVLLAAVLPVHAGIRWDIEYLSSPMLEGRGFATRGDAEASFYIIRRLRSIGLEARVQCFRTQDGAGHNVYAVVQGNPRSDKYILVCARYDGLGTIQGNMYPGADANASGAAVMLYLAQTLKDCGGNFIFAALDAHAQAMAGAAEFSGLPYKISMAVNLDTIGSTLAPPNKYRPDFLIALGGQEFEKELEKANYGPRLRLYYDYYRSKSFTEYFYTKSSEHAVFLRKGIKCVMFTSGITMNTNKVSDTAETLDYEVLERRAELIRTWLAGLK